MFGKLVFFLIAVLARAEVEVNSTIPGEGNSTAEPSTPPGPTPDDNSTFGGNSTIPGEGNSTAEPSTPPGPTPDDNSTIGGNSTIPGEGDSTPDPSTPPRPTPDDNSTIGGNSTDNSTFGGNSTDNSTSGGNSTDNSSSGGNSTDNSTSGGNSTDNSTSGGDAEGAGVAIVIGEKIYNATELGKLVAEDGTVLTFDEKSGVTGYYDENGTLVYIVTLDVAGEQHFKNSSGEEEKVEIGFFDDKGNVVDEDGNVIARATPSGAVRLSACVVMATVLLILLQFL